MAIYACLFLTPPIGNKRPLLDLKKVYISVLWTLKTIQDKTFNTSDTWHFQLQLKNLNEKIMQQ